MFIKKPKTRTIRYRDSMVETESLDTIRKPKIVAVVPYYNTESTVAEVVTKNGKILTGLS